jgi:hypothetical protein
MTIQVELNPETEARLMAESVARGLSLQEYVGQILRSHARNYATGTGILKPGDVDEMTRELTLGSEKLPVLPPEVNNRESYYEDRQ